MKSKSVKTMILGIMIMIFGGFLSLQSVPFFGDYDFLILVIGLMVGVGGLLQKD